MLYKCVILHVSTSKTFLQMFCKSFVWHVTTSYLQHVFNMLKRVLQHFCKCLSVKHLQNMFRAGYMRNKTLKFFCKLCKCFILHVTTSTVLVSKNHPRHHLHPSPSVQMSVRPPTWTSGCERHVWDPLTPTSDDVINMSPSMQRGPVSFSGATLCCSITAWRHVKRWRCYE